MIAPEFRRIKVPREIIKGITPDERAALPREIKVRIPVVPYGAKERGYGWLPDGRKVKLPPMRRPSLEATQALPRIASHEWEDPAAFSLQPSVPLHGLTETGSPSLARGFKRISTRPLAPDEAEQARKRLVGPFGATPVRLFSPDVFAVRLGDTHYIARAVRQPEQWFPRRLIVAELRDDGTGYTHIEEEARK
jgi:hypothetical protein